MSIYKILRAGDPALRQNSKPVSNFDRKIEKLIAALVQTLKVQKDPVGVGLAAPQVGKLFRFFIVRSGKNTLVFINPEILWKSKETNDPKEEIRDTKEEIRKKKKSYHVSRITYHEEREYLMEGCLSLPHYYGPVRRAKSIKVKYQVPKLITLRLRSGQANHHSLITTTKSFRGLSAQIIQHEVDHLNGILFIDRLIAQKRKLYEQKGKEWVEVELP